MMPAQAAGAEGYDAEDVVDALEQVIQARYDYKTQQVRAQVEGWEPGSLDGTAMREAVERFGRVLYAFCNQEPAAGGTGGTR